MSKGKIIVAMSGGVDSAVTAGLLMEEGYEVIGVNLRTWEYEAPACDTTKKSCCSPEDIRDARDVGLSLNIPFYVIKMEKLFQEKVIDRFVNDYKEGKTPNPCVECNTFVKFGALFDKAKALGIDKIATGHYARILEVDGRYSVANAEDMNKNQAYYLYGLSQENLKNTVFPLGGMTKPEVREIARRMGLPVAEKAESQEICFIPENDYRKFLAKKNIDFTPGAFALQNGQVIGHHTGKENFTIGQRKGLGIAWKSPLYVISIQDDGTVILGEERQTFVESFVVEDLNLQAWAPVSGTEETECRVQVRYRSKPIAAKVVREENQIRVFPLEEVKGVAPGQSAVFYPSNGNYLLAGGIIRKGSVVTYEKSDVSVLENSNVGVSVLP
ncbi:tRNA 2-thiouridine(34) synthase MnmA [Leptospira semungkisensis]|uniref:tRNA-specific 2-thiouridylase MnmA n=1 Tax=Leptospira semungkisensis TaxID=2484985 RepID=A0A4R9FQJ9_9LEPT|nr:tRNA 2-thiouridine(34) synthase MnmA [Leptospira semungkisensis]TGK00861.1 tRNA 2-thiouridine(34) synthase MnmA [Leptospira semungkisensis]